MKRIDLNCDMGEELLGSMSMTRGNKLKSNLILLRGCLIEKQFIVTTDFSYIKEDGKYIVQVRSGPDSALYNKKQIMQFINMELKVTQSYNRMGVRFKQIDGNWKTEINFVTKPVFPGCIQITPNGTPILIMNDGQTTGGYPVIAVIDKKDMKKAGQLKFGDRVIMHKLSQISDIINR